MFAMRKALLVTLVVFVFAAVSRSETLEEIITMVEDNHRDMKDMSAEFEMKMDVMGQAVSASGEMKMVPRSGKVYMDMQMQMMGMQVNMKIVSNGRELFQEMKVGDRVIVNRVDVKKVPGLNIGAMAGMSGPGFGGLGSVGKRDYTKGIAEMKRIMDLKVVGDGKLDDGQEAWVIEGKFKPEYYRMLEAQGKAEGPGVEVLKSQLGGMRIYIGKESKYMNKMEFLSSTGAVTGSMTFRNVVKNTMHDEDGMLKTECVKLFSYTPAAGVSVNDMTEMMQKKMAAMGVRSGKSSGARKRRLRAPTALLKTGINAAVFRVESLDGTAVDLEKLRGKPVVIFFWATWHPGAVKQLVQLNKLSGAWGSKISFMALSTDKADEIDEVKKEVITRGIHVTVALGTDDIFDAYMIKDIPCYVVLDAKGRVVASETRQRNLAALKKALDALGENRKTTGPAKPVTKAALQ